MVNVKLMEKSVKSHVGSVMVVKVMIQYNPRGITWKMKVNTQVIHPAMVEGVGGRKGGGWWVDTADRAVAAVAAVAAAAVGVETVAASAASERTEGAEAAAAAEFRPVDEDEAADVRLRVRDGARPAAMVGDLGSGGGSDGPKCG